MANHQPTHSSQTNTARQRQLPWWVRRPINAVTWVATHSWNRTRHARTIPAWLIYLTITATATLTMATAATAVITTAALIALPARGVTRWHARRASRHHDTDTHQPPPRTRPAPRPHLPNHRRALSTAFQHLLDQYRTTTPAMPTPVTVYAGRYEAAIIWRTEIETFAAYITKTNPAGELQAVWLGTHPAQYPTIHSLAEALNGYGIGLDPASRTLANNYQQDIWNHTGPCKIVGTRDPNHNHQLAIVTPKGKTQPIAPAPQRDQRSAAFGPPTPITWGPENHQGNLETARCILDYTDSTTRTPQQLFNDARELAVTTIRNLPPNYTIDLADLHHWTTTRKPVTHQRRQRTRQDPEPQQHLARPDASPSRRQTPPHPGQRRQPMKQQDMHIVA